MLHPPPVPFGLVLPAGKVSSCLDSWKRITADPWTLQVVQGYRIEWTRTPFQLFPIVTSAMSRESSLLVEEEIQNLLQKGAVVMASPCQDQFISRLFLVPKKDGSFRPVVNLKPLNCFVQKFHFKMEGSGMIKDLLRKGDWMCTLDLKDAYLSVAIVQEHRRFLRFMWNGRIFEFTCLPFGLCSAPRIFMKLLHLVMAHLRKQGLQGL